MRPADQDGDQSMLQTVAARGPGRVVMDCRKYSKVHHCSLTLSGTEAEVLDAVMLHAVQAHGHEDTPAFREVLRNDLVAELPQDGAGLAA